MKSLMRSLPGILAVALIGSTDSARAALPLEHGFKITPVVGPLEHGFKTPPGAARPWVYWFPLDGNISSNGITLDLEAMQRVGVGGVLYMETDQGAPIGPARFGGPLWRELFKHACAEANRLGLEVNMNNDAGWCGSGGPWITPELSMQRVVWTELMVEGPRNFGTTLARPNAVANYYQDIVVLAFPTPEGNARIENIKGKAAFVPLQSSLPGRANWPSVPVEKCIAREKVVDLTKAMQDDGRLIWTVPEGKWTILRLGHTTTGKDNHPAPKEGRGLECDKLSKAAAEVHFNGLMGKLIKDVGSLAGKTLVSTHIDSWEVGTQNWTPKMRQEFRSRRGYDLIKFLPVMTGRVVDSVELSERFLWDLRQTISELLLENYAGHFRTMAHRHGMRLSIEAYHTCPTDEMAYAGRCDEPMGEFWSWPKYGTAFSCTEMVSAGHVYGRKIIGAEAFTATDGERWLGHPGSIKELGDWAFCEGINRFVFHRYALQPWDDRRPGMSMGPWGLHYERGQTWWEQSKAWHEYLARCQYLLQQGLFVADICLLSPEGAPQTLNGQKAFTKGGLPLERPGYNFDTCPPEVVLERMTVNKGRLVLPDGMSYRVLVLPNSATMTPALLRKIQKLAEAGATIIGAPPLKAPGLTDFPKSDEQVQKIAKDLWGEAGTNSKVVSHKVGKGQVITGGEFGRKQEPAGQESVIASAKWIWRKEGNPAASAAPGARYFRRQVVIEPGARIETAWLFITADNSFRCWVNGRSAGSGDNFGQIYELNVASLLKPGTNLIAVEAVNATDRPNPAGLIGALRVKLRDGQKVELKTDTNWEAAQQVARTWRTEVAQDGWSAAMELGALGMEPWGDVEQSVSSSDIYPNIASVCNWLASTGLAPDFLAQGAGSGQSLRYIHRVIGGTDVYFVANKTQQPETALCSFRVKGKWPELWFPKTGQLQRVAVYDEGENCTRVPLTLEPNGSVFVVFRAEGNTGPERIVSVSRNGETILDTKSPNAESRPSDNNARLVNTFAFAVWAKPTAETELLPEANTGMAGYGARRNDALFPPPGHEVYEEPGQAGAGLALGSNGVCVFEHAADYFAPVLVQAVPMTNWTHVTVVYEKGQPSLYLNGQLARKGLKSQWSVHPGVGVQHGRPVTAFKGALGEFRLINRLPSSNEIVQLSKSMPLPADHTQGGSIELAWGAAGTVEAQVWQPGKYVLKTAQQQMWEMVVPGIPQPVEISGPWEVQFTPGWGAPERVTFDKLMSWSEHTNAGVKYFSGTASYKKSFSVPAELIDRDVRLYLDLGRVEVIAEVKLNGLQLGTLWTAPFMTEVTQAVRPGENTLEVKVVNLWINRMIGDEQLPEDSERNANGTLKAWPPWLQEGKPSPTGRYTFTSWRLWKKDARLQGSGLLGPVMIKAAVKR